MCLHRLVACVVTVETLANEREEVMQDNPRLVGDADPELSASALCTPIGAHAELGVDNRLAEREKRLQHFRVAVLDPCVAVVVDADQVKAVASRWRCGLPPLSG